MCEICDRDDLRDDFPLTDDEVQHCLDIGSISCYYDVRARMEQARQRHGQGIQDMENIILSEDATDEEKDAAMSTLAETLYGIR